MDAQPLISSFALGPFETNCYVVRFGGKLRASEQEGERREWKADGLPGRECWIVDAGYEPEEMIEFVQREGLRPVALVLTHAHCDHIAGAFDLVKAFPKLPVWIHEAEEAWLSDPLLNLSIMTGVPATAPAAARLLREGDVLELSGQPWRVLHTPGHSPGGITLWHEPSASAIVGDSLFAGSIGRTDFPGSDHATLMRSIREKLYTLPDATRMYPGHGEESTIGREKRGNPFVRG